MNQFQFSHYLVLTFLFILTKTCDGRMNKDKDNPDIYLSASAIIRRQGYPAETHTVQTDDGYILNMHRIPHGLNEVKPKGKKAVAYLQHGTLSSSADWLVTGPKNALAFILADAGYDVWLGNARGNTYSTEHTSLKHDGEDFWDFSWDQFALYDLPAEINYILRVTGQPDLTYIGHSLGASIIFATIATYPEFNKKVNIIIDMAPAIYVSHTRTPLRHFAPFAKLMGEEYKIITKGKQLTQGAISKYVEEESCGQNRAEEELCGYAFFFLGGLDRTQLNESLIPVIVSHSPAGTSALVGVQYAQQIKSERFCRYDFGPTKNMEIYNSTIPPLYPLENVKVPVAFFYSENDLIVTPTDVENAAKKLSNVVEKRLAPAYYNHFDFLYAKDAPVQIYPHILRLMKKYSNNGLSYDVKIPIRPIRSFFWKNWFN